MKAIWFSRHQPVDSQFTGVEFVELEKGIELGSRNIETDEDLEDVLQDLADLAHETEAEAVFGVFAAPVQSELMKTACDEYQTGFLFPAVPCYAAWNIARTPEGGRPTFEFKEWCHVGYLSLADAAH